MNFDSIARCYWLLERLAFGGALQRCRLAHVDSLAETKSGLILGEGDGRFLEAFLERNSTAKVTVVDSSRRMIELARERVTGSERVTFVHADARGINLHDQQFDLIVAHFYLDCFVEEDARKIVQNLTKRLASGGFWLWSDFAAPSNGWARLPSRMIVGLLYRFFRMTTSIEAKRLINIGEIFDQEGLELIDERGYLKGLLRSELRRNGRP